MTEVGTGNLETVAGTASFVVGTENFVTVVTRREATGTTGTGGEEEEGGEGGRGGSGFSPGKRFVDFHINFGLYIIITCPLPQILVFLRRRGGGGGGQRMFLCVR